LAWFGADGFPLGPGRSAAIFRPSSNRLPPGGHGVMNERDKLHLTITGYQIWADALNRCFMNSWAPPAATDAAPAATGDPRAARRAR
jgi:lysophospholipase L1-like esterase